MITKISNAQPLQFWQAGKTPYNEQRPVNIDMIPFFMSFYNDMPIISQYIGDAVYDLVITDEAGTELYRTPYILLVAGVYQKSILLSSVLPSLDAFTKIRFCVVDPEDEAEFTSTCFNPDFEGLLYYTDALEILFDEDPSYVKVKYTNVEDYAGIEGYSEEMVFELLFNGRFREERQVETNETEELDNTTTDKLSSTVKTQRLLELEPAPDYFFKKLLYALQHNSVEIDEVQWVKPEAIEKTKLDDQCDLKSGKAWLTLKEEDYFTNVYGPVTI